MTTVEIAISRRGTSAIRAIRGEGVGEGKGSRNSAFAEDGGVRRWSSSWGEWVSRTGNDQRREDRKGVLQENWNLMVARLIGSNNNGKGGSITEEGMWRKGVVQASSQFDRE